MPLVLLLLVVVAVLLMLLESLDTKDLKDWVRGTVAVLSSELSWLNVSYKQKFSIFNNF